MNAAPHITWRKSTHSHGDSGQCVELAALASVVGIRDTKNRAAGHLTLTKQAFATLLNGVKSGHHDR